MLEEKIYSEKEIEKLSDLAAEKAMEHFKHGVSCGECVLLGYLELNLSDFPKETVALASGFGAGMGKCRYTCGAVNAGMIAIGTRQGRKDPYRLETFEERVDELNHEGTGIYDRHGKYIRDVVREWGSIQCKDFCMPFEDFHCKDRARKCKKIIGFCAKQATKAALKK